MPGTKEQIAAYSNKPLSFQIKLWATVFVVLAIALPLFLIGRALLIAIAPIKAIAYLLMWKPYTAKESLTEAFQVPLSLMDVLK
jgi:hypothetical protein